MFDTENILGQLVLGHLKKLAQAGLIPVPQRSRRPGEPKGPQAPLVRAGADPGRTAMRQRKFDQREKAYNQWAANRARFDANKNDLRDRQMAGVKNRQEAAKARSPATPVNTGAAAYSKAGRGTSDLVDRSSPEYRQKLTAMYADQGVEAPAWTMNTNQDTTAANVGVENTAQMDAAVSSGFNPPANGGGGSGMTPGSAASGVGTSGTSTPAGMTTGSTLATGIPSTPAASVSPQMPSSGPSASQGSTAMGPTSSPQVNSDIRLTN